MDVKVCHTYKMQVVGELIQEIRVIYRMIESGVSIVAMSKILGHADLKTTMRYAHPEDSLKDAVALLAKSSFSDSLTDKSTDMSEIWQQEHGVNT